MKKLLVAAVALGALARVGLSFAAKPAADRPRYDPNTEYTFRGTVVDICRRIDVHGNEELHAYVDIGHGRIDVHLAPVVFLAQRGLALAKGDAVVVTGSRTKW